MRSHALLFGAGLAAMAIAQPAAPPESAPVRPPAVQAPVFPQKSPGRAVLLSFLLPGGGQVYTGNWWKAAFIAPAEVTLGYFAVKEHIAASDADARGDSVAYLRHRDHRTAFLWWTGAVLAFSMADAYVSAQMYGFDREIRLTLGPLRAGLEVGL